MSVRHACFLCPMVVVAGLDWLLSSGRRTLRDTHTRFSGVTLAGLRWACWVMPRRSGLSAAVCQRRRRGGSFVFNPLTARQWGNALTVFAIVIGWRGGAALFSLEAQPTCVAAVLVWRR
ncbi:MAG: hypothetical protein ACLUI3_07235 [Christensenellales bacterium]